MTRAKALKADQKAAKAALEAAGVPEAESFVRQATRLAFNYRKRLMNPRYLADGQYTRETLRSAERLSQWLTAMGCPVLRWPPAPSNGLRHSVYIDPRRPILTLHINGVDYAIQAKTYPFTGHHHSEEPA